MCSVNTCKAVFKEYSKNDEDICLVSLCFNLEKCEACAYKKQVTQFKKETYEAVEAKYKYFYELDRTNIIEAWGGI